MPPPNDGSMAMRSVVIVTLQLGLIAAIAVPFGAAGWNHAASMLVAAGVALGIWAVTANRPGNFNIRPEPKSGGQLVQTGPYRYIRHPMYSALMLAMLGLCIGYATPWRWAALVALAIVIVVKAGLEETAMAARHADYADYARSTRRFVPFVW
jgi:protein-S-isoprenylcysteine O-methyltransferase Ste14